VYSYRAGKTDWFASGLPRAGRLAGLPIAADALRRDVPTCRPDEAVSVASARARAAACDVCVVVNDRRIVLGILRDEDLAGDQGRQAEDAMESGPTTIRPNELLADIAYRLTTHGVEQILVSTAGGELIGLLQRDEAVRRTGGSTAPTADAT
jgi:CBS domain-containing protein